MLIVDETFCTRLHFIQVQFRKLIGVKLGPKIGKHILCCLDVICLDYEGKESNAELCNIVIRAIQGYEVCCSGHRLQQTPMNELLAEIR